MATADQIEKIILEIEERGAAGAGVAIKRLNDQAAELERRRGPSSVASDIERVTDTAKAAKSNVAALNAELEKAEAKAKKYDQAQSRKHERNQALEATRKDARAVDAAMKAASRTPTGMKEAPKALTAGQKAFQAFARTFGPRATRGLVSTVGVLEKIGPVAAKIGPPLLSAGAAAGAVGVALAGGAAYAAVKFGGAVVEAQAFREDMTSALDVLLKGSSTGDAALRRASETADFIGQSRADVAGQFTDLAGKFKDVDQIDKIVRSLADLGSVDPKANLESLTRAIGQIQAKGKLSGEELMQLSEAGLETGDVFEKLAKSTGKSIAQVQKDISAGKISADVGIWEGILPAIGGQVGGGPAGAAAAAKARNNLSGLLRRVEDIPSNILFDVAVGPGIGGVKGFLSDILDYFDASKSSGKEVRKVTGDLFNALIEGLTGNKVDTSKGIVGTLDAIVDGARAAVPLVKETASAVRDIGTLAGGIISATRALDGYGDTISTVYQTAKGFTSIARWVMAPFTGGLTILPEIISGFRGLSAVLRGDTSKALDHLADVLPFGQFAKSALTSIRGLGTSIPGAFSEMWASLGTAAAAAFNSASNIGTNLWQGIVNGIRGGIGAVTGAATSLANSALGAVGATWRVGSPAKAFEEQALWAGAGTERGFYRSTSGAVEAASYMANQSLGAAWAAGQANGNGGAMVASLAPAGGGAAAGGGPIVINNVFNIVVPGSSSPVQAQELGAAAGRAARAQFEVQLGDTMRRLRYG